MPIKVLVWNANSLITKKPELSRFLDSNPHDILLISETRLKDNTSFHIPSYSCYRNDREHGGVAIFIKSKIPHSCLVRFSNHSSEAIAIKIHDGTGDFNITSLYCSPHLTRAEAKDFFRNVLSINGPTIIAGDFNAKHSAWNNTKFCRKGVDLYNLCIEKNFSIHAPSDITLIPYNGGKPSVVDFVISKMFNGVSKPVSLVDSNLSSDHFPITFNVVCNSVEPEQKVLNYKKADWNKFRSITSVKVSQLEQNFPPLNSTLNIDNCVNSLTTIITEAKDQAIPKRNPYRFRYPFSNELHNLTKYRNYYRNRYKRTLNAHDKSIFTQLNRLIRQETTKLNLDAFSQKVASLKVRDNSLYGLTKSLKRKKQIFPPLKRSVSLTLNKKKLRFLPMAFTFVILPPRMQLPFTRLKLMNHLIGWRRQMKRLMLHP